MKIGQGASREVYDHGQFVLKYNRDRKRKTNQNKKEWENWLAVQGTEYEPYFAPCMWLIDDVLCQVKCGKNTYVGKLEVPFFLDDCKRANFGIWEGRIVCFDYSPKPVPDYFKLKTIHFR